ncbi:MAG: hypothetical protein ACLQVD_01175 [Capsulimonadaceae bacterium]
MSKRFRYGVLVALVVFTIGTPALTWWAFHPLTYLAPPASDISTTGGNMYFTSIIAYFGFLVILRLAATAVRAWGRI